MRRFFPTFSVSKTCRLFSIIRKRESRVCHFIYVDIGYFRPIKILCFHWNWEIKIVDCLKTSGRQPYESFFVLKLRSMTYINFPTRQVLLATMLQPIRRCFNCVSSKYAISDLVPSAEFDDNSNFNF